MRVRYAGAWTITITAMALSIDTVVSTQVVTAARAQGLSSATLASDGRAGNRLRSTGLMREKRSETPIRSATT